MNRMWTRSPRQRGCGTQTTRWTPSVKEGLRSTARPVRKRSERRRQEEISRPGLSSIGINGNYANTSTHLRDQDRQGLEEVEARKCRSREMSGTCWGVSSKGTQRCSSILGSRSED